MDRPNKNPLSAARNSAFGVSIFHRLALLSLILAMPVLLAYWFLTSAGMVNLLMLAIPVGFAVLTSFSIMGQSFQVREHRLLIIYFGAVGFLTLVGGLRLGFSEARQDLIALATLGIWVLPFFVVYHLIDSPRTYAWAMGLVDVVGVGIAGSVLFGFVGPRYLGIQFGEYNSDGTEIRAFGPFGDQVGFPLVYFAVRSVFRGKIFLLTLFCSAILLTGTRGAVLSLAVGMVAAVLLGAGKDRKSGDTRHRFVLIALWALVFIIGFLMSDFGATTRTRLQSMARGETSLQQRLASMSLGLQVVSDNPIGGVGFLGFRRMGAEYGFHQRFAGDVGGNSTYTAQNQYIQSALDGGVIALGFWVAFLVCLYRRLKESLRWLDPFRQVDVRAGIAWLVALAVGNQAAVWFLSHCITSYVFALVFAILLSGLRFPNPTREAPSVQPKPVRS